MLSRDDSGSSSPIQARGAPSNGYLPEVDVEVLFTDFICLAFRNAFRASMLLRLLGGYNLAVGGFLTLWDWENRPWTNPSFWRVLLQGSLLIIALLPVMALMGADESWSKFKANKGRATWAMTDEGPKVTSGSTTVHATWASLWRVEENATASWFFPNKQAVLILPKRAFKEPAHLAAWREQIRAARRRSGSSKRTGGKSRWPIPPHLSIPPIRMGRSALKEAASGCLSTSLTAAPRGLLPSTSRW